MVDESNLQRQIIHGQSDVGGPKAHSARGDARGEPADRRPAARVPARSPTTPSPLFADYDLILDGTDNFATRYLVNDAAALAGKPYVGIDLPVRRPGVGVLGGRPRGPGINYRDLYPDLRRPGWCRRAPRAACWNPVRDRRLGDGDRAIKLIGGIGEPLLGRLLIYDALAMTFRTVRIRKDPGAEGHRADRLSGVLRTGRRR